MRRTFSNGRVLRVVTGDITKIPADAIVNAANSRLAGGGGVDGAIHRAGGPSIMRELDSIRAEVGGCPTGGAVATGAGRLPAKHIFHAVGPVYRDGTHGEAELLASCYETCLNLAEERGIETISFPAIGAGVYGYPIREAARIAIETVTRRLDSGQGSIREAILVAFDPASYRTYEQLLVE